MLFLVQEDNYLEEIFQFLRFSNVNAALALVCVKLLLSI